jgi:hypothetical protein
MPPLPHDKATANIFIDGLGICCFNTHNVWEIGFLRHNGHGHELILDIDGHPDMPMMIEDKEGIVIHITTEAAISPHGENPDGFFDQGAVPDRKKRPATLEAAENFSWVIDLENPRDINHGPGELVNPPHMNVTRAFMHDAVFYTQSLPVKRLHRLLDSEDGHALPDPEFEALLFGRVNDLVGADITCAVDGLINIAIEGVHGGPVNIGPLHHRPGNPWQISLTNMRDVPVQFPKGKKAEKNPHGDHDDHVVASRGHGRRKGDFQLYYDAFELADPTRKQSLWGFADLVDFRSGRTDCNLVFAGRSPNLDDLL